MLKRIRYTIIGTVILTLLCAIPVVAQLNNMGAPGFGNLPQEGVYLHQNNSVLFAGERLYYKIYCLDLRAKKLGDISKIAYVQLLDDEKKNVFSHKLKLNEGIGSGDFAIPAELSTGSYKLVGYTHWMLSRSEKQYFESDLFIINPYKATPEKFLEPVLTDSIALDSTVPVVEVPAPPKTPFTTVGEQLLSLDIDGSSFSTRSPVELTLTAMRNSAIHGNYSLTVRKLDSLYPQAPEVSIADWWKNGTTWTQNRSMSPVIPELRGELFSGMVRDKESGEPAAGVKVVLSLPGDPFIMDIAQTNSEGRFYFNLDSLLSGNQAVFQLLGQDRDSYDLVLDERIEPDYNLADFVTFTLSKELEGRILERSIHNQIENAYGIVKSDTVVNPIEDIPFYRNYQQRFFLDDFTRFNTLRETMVEIIDNAWIDENGDEDPTFGVRPFDGYLDAGGLLPMVFVDGLFIQDHKNIVDYNSKEIRSIALSRDRYLVGSQVFQGVLAMKTKSGEFYETLFREHLLRQEIDRPEALRRYYFEDHGRDQDRSRVPDFRYQLCWNPELFMESHTTDLKFWTSDVKGSFEVEVKGFTADGAPVALRKQFTVD